MRVVILGATGLLGHKVVQVFGEHHDVHAAVRTYADAERFAVTFGVSSIVIGDVSSPSTGWESIFQQAPDVVINCLGIVKQAPEAANIESQVKVNALFPHSLARLCHEHNARLIHISSDCVFSGLQGMYTEDSVTDPIDTYGQSKLLGEPSGSHCLVLRTSFVGPEYPGARSQSGLLHWLQSSPRQIKGYAEAFFSGLPTLSLAQFILTLVDDFPHLAGTFHCASERISKYELALLISNKLMLGKEITPVVQPKLDRSLSALALSAQTGFQIRSWQDLSEELAEDCSRSAAEIRA